MSLEYVKELKEKSGGHPVLEKAFNELVMEALRTRKEIASFLKKEANQSPHQKQGEVTLLEARFDGNAKIHFCNLCRANGFEIQFGAFSFDDLCNSAI